MSYDSPAYLRYVGGLFLRRSYICIDIRTGYLPFKILRLPCSFMKTFAFRRQIFIGTVS